MKYLVDSNVLSEPTKRQPAAKVVQWLRDRDDECATSILVLGEVERGIMRLPEGQRKTRLSFWLQQFADEMERRGRIMGIDRHLMRRWAEIYNREEVLTKRKPPILDSILAATAEMHGLTMVTRNVKDFPASLPVINPWDA